MISTALQPVMHDFHRVATALSFVCCLKASRQSRSRKCMLSTTTLKDNMRPKYSMSYYINFYGVSGDDLLTGSILYIKSGFAFYQYHRVLTSEQIQRPKYSIIYHSNFHEVSADNLLTSSISNTKIIILVIRNNTIKFQNIPSPACLQG